MTRKQFSPEQRRLAEVRAGTVKNLADIENQLVRARTLLAEAERDEQERLQIEQVIQAAELQE